MNDLIKRQSAIDALDAGNLTISGEMNALAVTGYLNRVIKRLENLPGENDGWIPCSERLPEDNKEVLITAWKTTILVAWLDEGVWNCDEFFFDEKTDVTAWMPLPEPWKGETNG